MHYPTFNDTVPNRLAYDVLSILLRIEVKLDADVSEGDAGVGKGKTADTGLDHVLAEADNEGVGFVGFELGSVFA